MGVTNLNGIRYGSSLQYKINITSMAKQIKATSSYKSKAKVSRPGVHSKKGSSALKTSKNYKKGYVGQGK
jgi:hypothetical protein